MFLKGQKSKKLPKIADFRIFSPSNRGGRVSRGNMPPFMLPLLVIYDTFILGCLIDPQSRP